MAEPSIDRRRFLQLGAGAVAVVGLGSCDPRQETTSPGCEAPNTTASTDRRRLVVVQLNGGNDLLNTLPPSDGRYRDARPSIAVDEDGLVALGGVSEVALHPGLAPLAALWDAGELAFIRGIGFAEPNRSHFVSMDRWWRADDLSAPGWLGRVLDGLPTEPVPLYATALGGGAPLLVGERVQPTVINSADSFRFTGIQPGWLSFGEGGVEGSFDALIRHAFSRAVEAVAAFAELTEDSPTSGQQPVRQGAGSIVDGLEVAAQLLNSDLGSRLVVVSAGGFDTHSGQPGTHSGLLEDLGLGLAGFAEAIEAGGIADEVMLVVTSEFGRRVAENGSQGTDHGAGGLAMAMGRGIRGGLYGDADLGNLLDGDVRPVVEPLALFTRCLDWLGVDADELLGSRDDGLLLLR